MTNYREQVFIDLHKLVASNGFDPAKGIAEFTEKYFIIPKREIDLQVDVSNYGGVYFYTDDYTNITAPGTSLEIDYDEVDIESAQRNAAVWAHIALSLLRQEEVNEVAESNSEAIRNTISVLDSDERRTLAQNLAQQGYVITKRPELAKDMTK